MATRAKSKVSKPAAATLTCPECGKTFSRPASLGAHRARAHGVAGSSKNAQTQRTRKTSSAAASNGRRSTQRVAAGTRRRRRTATASASNGRSQSVDRNALLKTLFPAGIPPREDVISSVNSWLDEAERLARLR
jgi:uncharacterized C2H2 Zn-finger protein